MTKNIKLCLFQLATDMCAVGSFVKMGLCLQISQTISNNYFNTTLIPKFTVYPGIM